VDNTEELYAGKQHARVCDGGGRETGRPTLMREQMRVINIYGGSKIWVESVLSNLALTPFILHDIYIASIEGFHQGIKYDDEVRRQKIFESWGVKAKSAGRAANRLASGYVYWGLPLSAIEWQSREYYDLYFDALFAKFTQNEEAKAALISTGTKRFTHIIPGSSSLTEIEFQRTHLCQSLYCIREFVQEISTDIGNKKVECSNKAMHTDRKYAGANSGR